MKETERRASIWASIKKKRQPTAPCPSCAFEFTIDWGGPPSFVHYFDPGSSTSIDSRGDGYEDRDRRQPHRWMRL
jgi:hypothetical protein